MLAPLRIVSVLVLLVPFNQQMLAFIGPCYAITDSVRWITSSSSIVMSVIGPMLLRLELQSASVFFLWLVH